LGYLAALTRLELLSDVIVLPQRQTALVAKQAAEVDVLSGVPSPSGSVDMLMRCSTALLDLVMAGYR
jgi:hypothetical protein